MRENRGRRAEENEGDAVAISFLKIDGGREEGAVAIGFLKSECGREGGEEGQEGRDHDAQLSRHVPQRTLLLLQV